MSIVNSISPLDKIHGEYFDLLNEYFGGIYIAGSDKFLQAHSITEMKLATKIILESIDDLAEDITSFWDRNATHVISQLKTTSNLRANYCGSLSPLDGFDFIKRTALYVDTVLIEDPLVMLTRIKDMSEDNQHLSRIIKHVFNLLDMRELFFGLGDKPVLTIFPPFFTEDNRQDILRLVNCSGLKYFEMLMETKFPDIDYLFEYMKKQNDINQLSKLIKHPQMLPKPEHQGHRQFLEEVNSNIVEGSKGFKGASVGFTLVLKVLGQLAGVGTETFHSTHLASQMVFDAESHWKMYKWSLTNNFRKPDIDDVIVNSLQLDDFKWLGNIPLDKLLQMRRDGELSSVRDIIRRNIYSSTHANTDLNVTAKQALANIEEVLKAHSMEVKSLASELKKKYFIDGAIAVAGLVVGVASGPLSPLSIAGLASTLYGVYDVGKGAVNVRSEKDRLESGVIGMLLQARKVEK